MNDRNLLYIHLFKIILEWSSKLQLTNKITLKPVMTHPQYDSTMTQYDMLRGVTLLRAVNTVLP